MIRGRCTNACAELSLVAKGRRSRWAYGLRLAGEARSKEFSTPFCGRLNGDGWRFSRSSGGSARRKQAVQPRRAKAPWQISDESSHGSSGKRVKEKLEMFFAGQKEGTEAIGTTTTIPTSTESGALKSKMRRQATSDVHSPKARRYLRTLPMVRREQERAQERAPWTRSPFLICPAKDRLR